MEQLADSVPDMPVEDRATDTLKPLIAIAGLARGHWPATARTAAVVLATDAA
jgi:hypothetical protein